MADEIQRTILQYDIDKAALNRSLVAIRLLANEQLSFERTTARMGTTGAAAANTASSRFAALRGELRADTAAVENLRAEILALDRVRVKPKIDIQTGAGGTAAGGTGAGGNRLFASSPLSRIGSELRMLPSVQTGLGFGTDSVANVIRVAGAVQSILGVSIAALGAGALAAAPLIAAAAAGIKLLSEELERNKQAVQAQIDAIRLEAQLTETNAEAARTRTSEENRRIAQIQQDRIDGLQQEADALNAQRNAARARLLELTQGRLDTDNVFRTGIGTLIDDIAAAIEAKKIQDEIDLLNNALVENADAFVEAGAQAANTVQELGPLIDAREQEEQAIAALKRAEEELLQQRLDAASELRGRITENASFLGLTGSAARSRIENNRTEILARQAELQSLRDAGVTTGKEVEKLRQELADLVESQKRLTQTYLPIIEEREREQQAIDDQIKAMEALQKISQDVTDAQLDIANAQAKLADENTRTAKAVEKILADERTKKAEAEAKAADDRVEATIAANADRLKAERDFRARFQQIYRQFKSDEATAIQDRNAVALDAARTRFKDEKEENQDAYREQLRTIDDNLKNQNRLINKRLSEQLSQARAAAQAALQIEAEKHNAEILVRQQALNIAIQQYNAFLSALQAGFAAATLNMGGGRQIVVPNSVILSGGTPLSRFQDYQRSQGVPGFANGLPYVPYDNMLARLHKGERVLTEDEARRYNNGGITINGYGMNKRQVLREVDKALTNYDKGLRSN